MVVAKRTFLNENRERVHVRWTAKRGNEIDLIGQLNVAWLLGHSRGTASKGNQPNTVELSSPCIMCVQYIAGCSVHREMFSTSEGHHNACGGTS